MRKQPSSWRLGPVRGGCRFESDRRVGPSVAEERTYRVKVAELDRLFPPNGPCAFCGDTMIGARHRFIDAIAERIIAGDSREDTMKDFGVTAKQVDLALAWRAWEDSPEGKRERRNYRARERYAARKRGSSE